MNAYPTFLILDDNEDSRYLTRHALLKVFLHSRVLEHDRIETALLAAKDAHIDAVITDHHLGTEDGCAFIAELRTANISTAGPTRQAQPVFLQTRRTTSFPIS